MYQFGDYTYPNCIIEKMPRETLVKQRIWDTPGRAGGGTAGGLLAPRRITLAGTLQEPDGADNIDDLWAAFVAAHTPGSPRPFHDETADGNLATRYLMAEVESVRDMEAQNYVRAIPFEVGFYCADPFYYGDTLHVSELLPAHEAVVVGGTADALPGLVIALSAVGAPPTGSAYPASTSKVVITNTTMGAPPTVLYARSVASVTIDSFAERIAQSGSLPSAALNRLLTGPFLRLVPGANVITITAEGGAVVSAATLSWRDRWY